MADKMKGSKMSDQWIYEACQQNPVAAVLGDDGRPTGSFTTGPVRLSFTDNLLQAGKKMKTDPNSAEGFGCTVLFTPWTDFTLFMAETARIVASTAEFKDCMPNPQGGFYGLRDWLRDQGEKQKFDGYTPGLKFTNTSANIKPNVVYPNMNPVLDKDKVYPGVWAILAVNFYASKSNKANMGVRMGLQSAMIIADDERLGGGSAPAPQDVFKNTHVAAQSAPPAAAFGSPPIAPPPGAPVGSAAVAAYYPPAAPPPVASTPIDPLAAFR